MSSASQATDDALASERAGWADQLDAAAARVDELNSELATSYSELAAAKVEIQRLRDLCRPTVFGSSFGVKPPALVPLGRSYLQPGERPTSWQGDFGTKSGVDGVTRPGKLWISPKVSDAAWLPQFAASLPAGVELMVSPWHEPENDGRTGHDLADYVAAYRAFKSVCDQVGALLLPILMKSKPEELNRRYLDAVLPYVGALGFDAYNEGIQSPKAYLDPAVVFEKPLRLADEYGLDLWIGETGTGLVDGDVGPGRVEWTRRVRAFLESQPRVRGVAWWSSKGLGWTPELFEAWSSR